MQIRSVAEKASLPDSSWQLRQTVPHCLCVDLDGTLIQSDTLLESLLAVVRNNPSRIPRILLSLRRGKSGFKHELGQAVQLSPETLPYSRPLLEYIELEAKNGREVFLVTGADASIAVPVAEYFGFFSGVICSNGSDNVRGPAKLRAIRHAIGHQDFSYAGNSRDDLTVWKAAKTAVIVNANGRVCKILEDSGVNVERVFPGPRLSVRSFANTLRIHQWIKNLLVFLPIFLGHRVFELQTMVNAVRAFFAFSLCASALYLINDMLDLASDRKHREKRFRPLASGEFPIPHAILLSIFLFLSSAVVNPRKDAALLLILYCASVVAYSVRLKRLLLLDVILLASFYTLRLLYGGAATQITLSIWTLAFSLFMFLSLALIKRICELSSHSAEDGLDSSGRGYLFIDLPQLTALSAASGCMSALIFILYVQSPDVMPLYSRPHLLLCIFPLLIYWHSRLLILGSRGLVHGDPILFSLSDRASRMVAIAVLAITLAAI